MRDNGGTAAFRRCGETRRQRVERKNLSQAKLPSLEDLAIQPPSGPTCAVEEDGVPHAKSRLVRDLLERLWCVAAQVTQNLVERSMNLRAVGNQDDGTTVGREHASDVFQCTPIVVDVFDNIQADNRIEPAGHLGKGLGLGHVGQVA